MSQRKTKKLHKPEGRVQFAVINLHEIALEIRHVIINNNMNIVIIIIIIINLMMLMIMLTYTKLFKR